MTPNCFPNVACLDTFADSASSWLWLGWIPSQQAQLSCLDCGGVPVWSTVEQIVVNIPQALPKMTCLHEEVSMQRIGMKFRTHQPLHIVSWGNKPYHVVVSSKIVIILHVGSHTSPSNTQHFNIKSIRFL